MVKLLSNYFFLCLAVTQAYDVWHNVDIQSVICPSPAPKNATISIDFNDLGHNNLTFPHIFSFYRTFNKSVKIWYKAVDANGLQIVGGALALGGEGTLPIGALAMVNLAEVNTGGRRLKHGSEGELKEKDLLEAEEDELEEDEDEREEESAGVEDAAEEKLGERRLLSARNQEERLLRSSGGKSKMSSSKSKSKSSSSSKAAKKPPTYSKTPPATGTGPASYKSARRRSNPASARRRDTPVPTGARRRIASPVDGKTYSNPSNAQAGNYGYSSPSKINGNYPGGYSPSSYGYSGANAHKSSSNKNMMMAAAGGAVVGMYVGSRWGHNGWGWRHRQCYNDGGSYSGSCSGCYQRYNRCRSRMNRNAARDDIMGTGFMPLDFVSPANFTIYKIEGLDFDDLSGLCPPANWDPDARRLGVAWTPKDPQPDLWVTVTALMELEETLALDVTHYAVDAATMHGPSFLLAALIAFSLRRLW